jgi:hypothetical protein
LKKITGNALSAGIFPKKGDGGKEDGGRAGFSVFCGLQEIAGSLGSPHQVPAAVLRMF